MAEPLVYPEVTKLGGSQKEGGVSLSRGSCSHEAPCDSQNRWLTLPKARVNPRLRRPGEG